MDEQDELNTGLLLFIPYRALELRVYTAVREAGFDDATPAQLRVFQRVGPHGTRLTELAEAAEITKQTAGFLVDQLEAAGYVERVPDPADRRARLVRVTARGAAASRVAAAELARVEAEWTAHLGVRGMASLRRQLARLREITDPWG
ncbi:MarR family winged helix-turn-helix transcriptional regulator [Cellulosimicrobium sp. E-16]|uniref:MarR family winged helix-turn-helix transcriptional regulator n=1 Tax=Cellulosimicrobium sp. E-16 TaxID=3404049 RepID=UPI003CF4BC8D